ncbi:MAG: RNA polymerase sigma-70 factor [Paludibacter sp.]
MIDDNQLLLSALKSGNKNAFTLLFRKYYKDLVLFGGNFISDKAFCEDIVQSVFLRLWENRATFEITTSLRSFLLQSVRNGCLDYIRHTMVVREHEKFSEWVGYSSDFGTENYVLYSELHEKLAAVMKELPSDCREAFMMNRFEGLKYKEIASKLSVSERTIEVRIGKALKLLRQYLHEYLVSILVYISLRFFMW